jgi:ABC-type glycerol-3-phosphate transport system permease component
VRQAAGLPHPWTGPAWLSNGHTALLALDIVGIWMELPVAILLYLAALQRIPESIIVSLPDELIAAARLDGAHWTTVLVRVVVPLAKPMSGAYCALAAVTAWNMYLWPLVVANTPSVQVLPQTLAPLASSTYGSQIPENVAFAATVITTLPMVVVFLIAQRSFVRGLTGSGVD